jgi:hypothetical protein
LKQRIGHKRKLGENDNSTKNYLVLQQVVTVHGQQNGPLFEALVHSLLLALKPLLYLSGIWIDIRTTPGHFT